MRHSAIAHVVSFASFACFTAAPIAASFGFAADAAAQTEKPAVTVRFELESANVIGRDASMPTSRPDRAQDLQAVRSRWWWRAVLAEVGAGIDWAPSPTSPTSSTLPTSAASPMTQTLSARPVFGLGADLSQRTRLVYELSSTDRSPLATAEPASNEVRWGLEFKSTNSVKEWGAGLLRVQMTGSSTLALWPRSGGLAMSWRTRF